jgi:hypothetical protein
MKKEAKAFVASLILFSCASTASADCVANARGHVGTLAYAGTTPYFIWAEQPATAVQIQPAYTAEQQRILLSMLLLAKASGFLVTAVCEGIYLSGVMIN